MSGDASGSGSDEGGGRRESSAPDPDGPDARAGDDAAWNATDAGSRSQSHASEESHVSARDRIPIDLSPGSDDAGADEGDEDDQYGPEPNTTPIEAGDPDLENAIFVALGAIAMVLVIIRMISIPL